MKWVDSNPFEGLEGGNTVNQSRWEYIPREATLEVMANCTNLEIRARIGLMRFAGCRGESEFKCLEWNADWIRWSEDGKPGTVRLHRTKTENSGTYTDTILPMEKELEKALRDLYDSVPAGTVKVFTPRANPGVMVKKQFRRNGFEIKNTYNLRKSFCRDLMEAGLDWKSYEYYSGHSLQVAMKHYQSWDELRAQKAAPKLLEALTGSDADQNRRADRRAEESSLESRNRLSSLADSGNENQKYACIQEQFQENKNPLQEVARDGNSSTGTRTPDTRIMIPLL